MALSPHIHPCAAPNACAASGRARVGGKSLKFNETGSAVNKKNNFMGFLCLAATNSLLPTISPAQPTSLAASAHPITPRVGPSILPTRSWAGACQTTLLQEITPNPLHLVLGERKTATSLSSLAHKPSESPEECAALFNRAQTVPAGPVFNTQGFDLFYPYLFRLFH